MESFEADILKVIMGNRLLAKFMGYFIWHSSKS